MTDRASVPNEIPAAIASARTKRPWLAPTCVQLPLLTELFFQVQGSGIGGGGGPGGTVFPP